MTMQPVGLASQPSSTFDTVVVPLKELNAAPPPPPPVFSFDSKDVKKAPPFTFSSLPTPAVGESFGLKFGAFSEPKPESSSRSVYIKCSKILGWVVSSLTSTDFNFSSPGFAVLQQKLLPGPQKYQNHPKLMILTTSTVSASTSTAGMFSFGSPSNINANQNNGLVTSSFSMFTSPSQLLISSNASNQIKCLNS